MPSDTVSKETTNITKTKKENSSKKRKARNLIEPPAMASALLGNGADRESTASPPIEVALKSPTSDRDVPEKPTKTKKPKKENSSKKRKSSALDESTHEPSTTSAILIAAQLPTSDDATAQEPVTKKRKASVEEIEVDINAPEPPSKKALRAVKKGKPLPPSKSGAESTPEPEPKKEKKAEAEKRSEYGVWIGNLPFSVSKEILRNFLVEQSDLTAEMITRVHMPGPNDSKPANKVMEKRVGKVEHNKGFAYVDFSTAEAVEWAVELSEQLLSGRRLLIKNHKSFEGRPEKTKEESRNDGKPAGKRIFLGNLSYDVTEESLKEHFEKCGAIESVKVATFEDSGKCKGYAWIVFEELEAAQNAVRGFVMIEEEASDASESEEDDDESNREEKIDKPKMTKRRKWWINKIKGRPMRMEFAEGAEVRYKKRYGKDSTKNSIAGDGEASGKEIKEKMKPAIVDRAPEYRPGKPVEYDRPYAAPRLTGGIVKSEGKKVTF